MKLVSIAGLLLILAGVAALVLGEVSISKHETVLQVGDAKIEVESKETIPRPPAAAGIAVTAGLVLVVVGLRGKSLKGR